MRDIDKALMLYGMMADRFEKSGLAPRQACVYREMADFMQGCESAAEAGEKIRNSKYFLAPGAALLQDKLLAFARAANENGMPDVAAVYQKKVEEIDADVGAMYETGYEIAAHNLKIQYIQTYEAFCSIYDHWLTLCCCNALDEAVLTHALNDLRGEFGKLTKPSADFAVLAVMPKFRELIPATDAGYARFVREVTELAASGPNHGAERVRVQGEIDEAQAFLANVANRQAVMAAGQAGREKLRRAQVIVVSPSSKAGAYTYLDEEVAGFE